MPITERKRQDAEQARTHPDNEERKTVARYEVYRQWEEQMQQQAGRRLQKA